MPKHFIIIGGGQAAAQAVYTLRQKKFDGAITLIGEESNEPYQRPPLSKKYLAGELEAKRLSLRPASFYADREITMELGVHAAEIDSSSQRVRLEDGRILDYDGLMLSTGSRVRRLEIPGSGLAGIYYLRTLKDADAIRAELVPGRKLVTVGAGYIGLEVASIAATLGLEVTVLEAAPKVMARVVCAEVSQFYYDYHSSKGVEILCSTGVSEFQGADHVTAVKSSAGQRHPCDIAVVGVGIEPVVELASGMGLGCEGGIHVDEYARTGDPSVFAAGDCTNHPNVFAGRSIRLESVHNAVEQAKTAALSLLGEAQSYEQVPWFWSDQYDLKLQIAGLSGDHDEVVIRGRPEDNSFSACYLRGRRLMAIDAVNAPQDFMFGKKIITAKTKVEAEQMADPATSFKDLL
jgi:3-phenylpropionate/trans-cinnamate dioxygenase ferredoxin reductase subunit